MVENNIERQVLERITPSNEYRLKLEKIIKEINSELEKEIKKRELPVSIELVGSTAKDTYLKDDLDIDFFLKFPTKYPKEEIAKNALLIGKSILVNTEESYAEHPYIRGYYKNFYVEVVPCYKIENATQKLSAVDRTPLHTKFVIENLPESQKSEVRLFKQFLKGINCYGAESEIEGFSGYLCEILIIKYGTFKKLLENAKKWKKGKKISLTDEKSPDFKTPLTFIDPVDITRNVASALSIEKFNLFVKASNEYLKKSSIYFFFPRKIKPWSIEKISNEIQKQGNYYLGVEIAKPNIIAENLFPQIRKATRAIWNICERYDFTIYDITYHVDEQKKLVFIVVNTKDETLSETFIHKGPPVRMKKNVKEFIYRWEKDPRVVRSPYEKNGIFYVEIKREYIEIKNFLNEQIKNLSLGKHLDKSKEKNYKIISLDKLLQENLRKFWTAYLDKKMPWER